MSTPNDPQREALTASSLSECTLLLRSGGATSTDLRKFEEDMRRLTPENVARIAQYLRRQSPAKLATYLERRRLDYEYVPCLDSQPQPGVPAGTTFEFTLGHSNVFPGTTRRITVYVPARYTGEKPACVYVGLDGLLFQAPHVFDNLIHRGEMPITIAIGVESGEVAPTAASRGGRFNRSLEFDALNGDLAAFLLDEVFPEVERRTTPDGVPILLSRDPNDRAAGGLSSGGIGCFTLAWERPDAFRRIFTASGTFVGMRGGDRYPVLIRKTEPKPIRIFMQDGCHDGMDGELGEVGDWWMGNQAMQRALQFSGYEVAHVWGNGSHGSKQGMVVFPDAMRWLWKDWPRGITAGKSGNRFLTEILRDNESWQVVPGPYRSAGPVTSSRDGAVIFLDRASGTTWRLSPAGRISAMFPAHGDGAAIAMGPDGRAYVIDRDSGQVERCEADGGAEILVRAIRGSNLLVDDRGWLYLTEAATGKLWLVKPGSEPRELDRGLSHPTALVLSADRAWLSVAESQTHCGYIYRVEPDGSTSAKQRFYWFHVSDTADDSGVGAWVTDHEGRLYAATRMGVQVFDRNGRVRAILPVPGGEAIGLAFGGPGFGTLHVSCADGRLYQRKLRVSGVPSMAEPIALPPAEMS